MAGSIFISQNRFNTSIYKEAPYIMREGEWNLDALRLVVLASECRCALSRERLSENFFLDLRDDHVAQPVDSKEGINVASSCVELE